MNQAVELAPKDIFVRARRGVVDDEPLAMKRLRRLLRQTRRVDIVGSSVDPAEAVKFLSQQNVDAVFLDIQMPGGCIHDGAFDRFALDAFEVNSVHYLLKPIEVERLEKALAKLERLRGTAQGIAETEPLRALARELTRKFPERISSHIGERVVFVEISKVTHSYAKDKLTYTATASKDYSVEEVSSWFGGGLIVRLKDGKRTELPIARDRVRQVKERLDF